MNDVVIDTATPSDASEILSLLERSGLPSAGWLDHLGETIVARRGTRVIGSAALEVYAGGGLLRSVAVEHDERGSGLGLRLAEVAVARAAARGLPAIFLLTTTADRFFPKVGFERCEREDVPPTVRESIEFTSACPASAIVMRKRLDAHADEAGAPAART
jgi:amino-acid N-acetyltransferase